MHPYVQYTFILECWSFEEERIIFQKEEKSLEDGQLHSKKQNKAKYGSLHKKEIRRSHSEVVTD